MRRWRGGWSRSCWGCVGSSAITLPGISRFATGLNADLAAVTAGLSLPFSSGSVEGNVKPHQNDQTADVRPRGL
jgi:hypothetical protein